MKTKKICKILKEKLSSNQIATRNTKENNIWTGWACTKTGRICLCCEFLCAFSGISCSCAGPLTHFSSIPLCLYTTSPGYHLTCLHFCTLPCSFPVYFTCISSYLYSSLSLYNLTGVSYLNSTLSICHLHDTSPVPVFTDGSGRDMCNRCHGRGVVQCPHCKGHGQVKNFIELTVSL